MKKEEFLDILRDYLSDSLSENEVEDILRDYDEYFINGVVAGKSEDYLVYTLGSPKCIAEEFKKNDEVKSSNTSKHNSEKKSKGYFKDILDVFNQEKEKVMSKDNHTIKKILCGFEKPIKILTSVVTTFIFLGLIGSIAACVIALPFINEFIGVIPYLKNSIIFMGVAYLGLEVLAWQLFFMLMKYKKLFMGRLTDLVRKYKEEINEHTCVDECNNDTVLERGVEHE